jgi:hypothetical protein
MKPKVYVETSTISYVVARPSRDLIIAANQQVTREWWNDHRTQFDLYISQVVINEANEGDKQAARDRLQALEGIPLLELRAEAQKLAVYSFENKPCRKRLLKMPCTLRLQPLMAWIIF